MNHLIIIRGPAGIGKTTISNELGNAIDAEVIHFDEVLHELGFNYIPGEKWIPLDKFLKADNMVLTKFASILEKKNLIIEGNFYHKEQILDLISKLNAKYKVFTLKADLEECIKRDKERKNSIGKQRITEVYNLVSKFDYGTIIDANNKKIKEVVNEIVRIINLK